MLIVVVVKIRITLEWLSYGSHWIFVRGMKTVIIVCYNNWRQIDKKSGEERGVWNSQGGGKGKHLFFFFSAFLSLSHIKHFFFFFFFKQWLHNKQHSLNSVLKVKLLSRVRLFAIPWTVIYQTSLSMGFSRQEYWSGLPFPSPGNLPDPGIKLRSPAF